MFIHVRRVLTVVVTGLVLGLVAQPANVRSPVADVARAVASDAPGGPLPEASVVAAALNDLEQTETGVRLTHPRHEVMFTPAAVAMAPRQGGPAWRWELVGLEAGGVPVAAVPITPVAPTLADRVVAYARGGLVEQYAPRAVTVEQQGATEPPFGGTLFLDPDIITAADPTVFTGLSYTGMAPRTMYDRRVNAFVTVDAFLFDAVFSDTQRVIEAQVNAEFGSAAIARTFAERYARMVGQLPAVLRTDIDALWIHRGLQAFGGGNRSVLIHTEQADVYEADGLIEETFLHESAHTSLDAGHATAPGWVAAQQADPTFISTYARDNPQGEDVAESFGPYLAVRHRPHVLTGADILAIEVAIPNRMVYFDTQGFNLHPFVFGPPPPPTPTGCSFTLTTTTVNIPAAGLAVGAVDVTASGPTCGWEAVSNSAFITILDINVALTAPGVALTAPPGSGRVLYSVAANTGAARTGTMTLAGQTVTANQADGTGGGGPVISRAYFPNPSANSWVFRTEFSGGVPPYTLFYSRVQNGGFLGSFPMTGPPAWEAFVNCALQPGATQHGPLIQAGGQWFVVVQDGAGRSSVSTVVEGTPSSTHPACQ